MITSLALDEGIIASRVLEGSFTHETSLEYLREDVVGLICFLFNPLLLSHLAPSYNTISRSPKCPVA